MDFGITGRVAMVAAASKGLGRAIAEALAAEGCRLSICSRSVESLEPARAAIAASGAEVLPVACDVAKAEDLNRLFDETQIGRAAGREKVEIAVGGGTV